LAISAIQILLIARDQRTDASVCASLESSVIPIYEVDWAEDLSSGLERLKKGVSAVLLKLSLRDGDGIEIFDKLFHSFPRTPILILVEPADEALGMVALQRGAQDYVLDPPLNGCSLSLALSKLIERSQFNDSFLAQSELAAVTLNSIGDAVLSVDEVERITFLNPVAEMMTGWSNTEAISRPLTEVFRIVDGATRETAPNPLSRAMSEDRAVRLTRNCLLIRRDGCEFGIEDSAAPIHNRAGRVTGAVIVFHDVSEARAFSARLTYSAHHDLLTGLPNRLLLSDRIKQSIALARRRESPLAVMFVDLDDFKPVNDARGHAAGDKLLRLVSERLVNSVRDADTVSRQGGDEFVILLSELADRHDAARSAERVLLALRAPYKILDSYLYITGSLGISVFPEDGEDSETMIGNADIAMYHAKKGGRNEYRFFEAGMTLERKATVE
jgi:diguanylate cyclase (GGDEF)-like protein/PAS domain S-box-containing protein